MKLSLAKIIMLVILLAEPFLWADDGASGMEFLNIGISARTAGTGEALSVLSDGPIASYYNPAGLAGVEGFQVAGMHSEWYQDMRYEYLGMAYPIGNNGAFGISGSYYGYGEIRGYTTTNLSMGNIDANDWSLGLSYGRNLSSAFSIGSGIKVVGEKLADVSAHGLAGDIGVQYRAEKYGAGLALLNLGPSIKFESASYPLPSKLDAGFSYYPIGQNLALLAGLSMPFHGSMGLRTGMEYTYAQVLSLRSGYDTGRRTESQGGLSFGAGFNFQNNSLDYAYNLNSVLGGTHQLSFTLRFGRTGDPVSFYKAPIQSGDNGTNRPVAQPKKTKTFLICAARYSARTDAEKHIESLKLFGLKPWIQVKDRSIFLVVLGKMGELPKAEKMKADFIQRGVSCFIEEE